MNLGYKDNSSLKKINYIEAYLCFLTFGILVGISKEEFNFVSLLSSMVFSLLFGYLFIKLMIYIFLKVNRDIFFDDKIIIAYEAVKNGMLFMIPFTILAVLASIILGWDSVMPFATAAIMNASAAAGIELSKNGAKGFKNIILPTLLSFIFSTGWMLVISILP